MSPPSQGGADPRPDPRSARIRQAASSPLTPPLLDGGSDTCLAGPGKPISLSS